MAVKILRISWVIVFTNGVPTHLQLWLGTTRRTYRLLGRRERSGIRLDHTSATHNTWMQLIFYYLYLIPPLPIVRFSGWKKKCLKAALLGEGMHYWGVWYSVHRLWKSWKYTTIYIHTCCPTHHYCNLCLHNFRFTYFWVWFTYIWIWFSVKKVD